MYKFNDCVFITTQQGRSFAGTDATCYGSGGGVNQRSQSQGLTACIPVYFSRYPEYHCSVIILSEPFPEHFYSEGGIGVCYTVSQ